MTAPRGFQGYNHRGRVLEPGPHEGTWFVEIVNLAPGLALGPVQSAVTGIAQGDTVLLTQVGTTREDLVIVGRLPGQPPDIDSVTGLSAALDALTDQVDTKADQTEVDTLTTRVGDDEDQIAANTAAIVSNSGSIGTNAAAISANSGAITALQARATVDETAIAANSAVISALPLGFGNDVSISRDLMHTVPRPLASAGLTMTNGRIFYARMRTDRTFTLRLIKYCVSTTGVGGSLTMAAWSGSTLSALTFRESATAALTANRHDWTLTSSFTMNAGDDLVLAFLGLANTTAPALAATPSVNVTLLDQDANTLTSVESSATVSALPTGNLNFATVTGMTLLGQIPWLAASS